MRRIALLTLLPFLLVAPVRAEPPDAADAAALRDIKETLWPRAYFAQDTALLDRILATEFRMIDGDGGWFTKADELAWVAANKPNYERLHYAIRRLEVFANGTAIVAGTGTMHARDGDGPYTAEYQSTNVLVRRDGRWQAVASHVSGYRRLPKS